MSGFSCEIPGCCNAEFNLSKSSRVTFHRFPDNPKLQEEWMTRCCARSAFDTEESRICSVHFTENDFEDTSSTRKTRTGKVNRVLKKNSVPTLHLPSKRLVGKSKGKKVEPTEITSVNEIINVAAVDVAMPAPPAPSTVVNVTAADKLVAESPNSMSKYLNDENSLSTMRTRRSSCRILMKNNNGVPVNVGKKKRKVEPRKSACDSKKMKSEDVLAPATLTNQPEELQLKNYLGKFKFEKIKSKVEEEAKLLVQLAPTTFPVFFRR